MVLDHLGWVACGAGAWRWFDPAAWCVDQVRVESMFGHGWEGSRSDPVIHSCRHVMTRDHLTGQQRGLGSTLGGHDTPMPVEFHDPRS